MKPKNFSGKKTSRKRKVEARQKGELIPQTPPHVADTRFRLGKEKRRGVE